MSLTNIKSAIEELSVRERCELNAWLQNWPDDEWDMQMRADADAGKLDWMREEAECSEREGTSRNFPNPKA